MAAPTIPGSYVGEHQNGYFWNGTSWEPGDTAAPSTAFGGTIINQQNAKPAPAPAVSTSPSKRASILSTIMRVESGGRNVPQRIDDINMRRGDPAQGFYQITGGTWNDFGGGKTGHKSAIDAPYPVQLQVAQNIPVQRWGPATQEALKRAGYEPRPGETLGQMLARYGEDPAGTKPEDVGGSSAGGATAVTAVAPNAGLLMPSTPVDTTAATAAAEKARLDKEQEAEFAAMTKTGMGLLQQAQPQPVQFMPAMDAGVHIPKPNPPALPNYVQQAQAADPFMEMLMRQRLQRRT